MKPFKIISREIVLDSPYCPIEKQIVELPNGEQTEWFVNFSHDAVIVIPILKSGEILLQKNYKHGSQEIVTEFCAGIVDDGETPLTTAQRELLEETGYEGTDIKKLGEVYANPTGSSMKYHFFVITGCEKKSDPSLEAAEQIETFAVRNIEKTEEILLDNQTITSSASIAALKFVQKFLQ